MIKVGQVWKRKSSRFSNFQVGIVLGQRRNSNCYSINGYYEIVFVYILSEAGDIQDWRSSAFLQTWEQL